MDNKIASILSFHHTSPLTINIYNIDKKPILFINNKSEGETLFLNIENTSDGDLTWKDLSATTASKDVHHFAITFRPGILQNKKLNTIQAKDTNQWSVKAILQQNNTVVVYVLAIGGFKINTAENLQLSLEGFYADKTGNSPSHLETQYQNLNVYPCRTRTQELFLFDQSGDSTIPLDVSFVNGNVILNNGAIENANLNKLVLRLTNNLTIDSEKSSIKFTGGSSASQSVLTFSFDAQEDGADKPWALGTKNQVDAIQIKINHSKVVWKEKDVTHRSFHPEEDFSLAPGEFIEVEISNILTTLPQGPSSLRLHYKNIKGYQRGYFVKTIIKSPLNFLDRGTGEIGFGTSEKNKLVFDSVKGQSIISNKDLSFEITQEIGNSTNGAIEFKSNIDKTEHSLMRVLNTGQVSIGDNPESADQSKLYIAQAKGIAVRVKPDKDKKVAIGVSELNGLVFDEKSGQSVNSTKSLSFNMNSSNLTSDPNALRFIDFKSNGVGYESGLSLMRINEDGTIGIGTGTNKLSNKVVINGKGGESVDLLVNGRIKSDNPSGGLVIGEIGMIGGHSKDKMGFWIDNDWRLTLQKDGNIGIGNTDPKAKLDIKLDDGHAIKVEPGAGKKVTIGRGDTNGLVFDFSMGQLLTSTANISLKIASPNQYKDQRYIDFRNFENNKILMRIRSTGKVGIGTEDPVAKLHIESKPGENADIYLGHEGAQYWGIRAVERGAVDGKTDFDYLGFYRNGNQIATIRNDGNWWNKSDGKLKKCRVPLNNAIENINKLEPVTFKWTDDESDKTSYGFIANEVEEIFPHLVTEIDGTKYLCSNAFGTIAIAGVKELKAEIDELREEVNALKRK